MKYEEIANNKKFQELLALVPEQDRSVVEEALKTMVSDFNEKVLKPLELASKK
jgi:hypothetical protein